MKDKKTVLVVDDDFAIRELISMALEREYNIIKAESGKEALETLKSKKPDIVILDIMMPEIDGYEVCRRIKSSPETKEIPVIMLTAKHEMKDVGEAIKANADEFITKPFEPEFLKKRIAEYFSQSAEKGKRKLVKYDNMLHYVKEAKN